MSRLGGKRRQGRLGRANTARAGRRTGPHRASGAPAAPPPSFRSSSTVTVNNSNNFKPTRPVGNVAGDLLVVICDCPNGQTITTPTGWTKQSGFDQNAGSAGAYCFTRTADGTATDLPFFIYSGVGVFAGAVMLCYAQAVGAVAAPVVSVFKTPPLTPAGLATYVLNTVTATVAALAVHLLVVANNNLPSAPTGAATVDLRTSFNYVGILALSEPVAAGATVGGYTGTLGSGSQFTVAYSMTLA